MLSLTQKIKYYVKLIILVRNNQGQGQGELNNNGVDHKQPPVDQQNQQTGQMSNGAEQNINHAPSNNNNPQQQAPQQQQDQFGQQGDINQNVSPLQPSQNTGFNNQEADPIQNQQESRVTYRTY